MKADIKAKWVKALRSKKYKQGKGHLRSARDSFCCLGVLCDLHAKATKQKWESTKGCIRLYKDCSAFLPLEVQEWAGLNQQHGASVLHDDCISALTHINDRGIRFSTIATLIEQQL